MTHRIGDAMRRGARCPRGDNGAPDASCRSTGSRNATCPSKRRSIGSGCRPNRNGHRGRIGNAVEPGGISETQMAGGREAARAGAACPTTATAPASDLRVVVLGRNRAEDMMGDGADRDSAVSWIEVADSRAALGGTRHVPSIRPVRSIPSPAGQSPESGVTSARSLIVEEPSSDTTQRSSRRCRKRQDERRPVLLSDGVEHLDQARLRRSREQGGAHLVASRQRRGWWLDLSRVVRRWSAPPL